jgi:hypothetical protein
MNAKTIEEGGTLRYNYDKDLGGRVVFNIRDIREAPYKKPIDGLSCIRLWDGNESGIGSISLSFLEFEALIGAYEAFVDKSGIADWNKP